MIVLFNCGKIFKKIPFTIAASRVTKTSTKLGPKGNMTLEGRGLLRHLYLSDTKSFIQECSNNMC